MDLYWIRQGNSFGLYAFTELRLHFFGFQRNKGTFIAVD